MKKGIVLLTAATCAGLLTGCTKTTDEPSGAAPVAASVDAPIEIDLEDLEAELKEIEEATETQVGLSLYDGATETSAGTVRTLPAWSTIKVPIALAAKEHCEYDDETVDDLISAAIEWSDNDSAYSLFRCLGSDSEAAEQVSEEIANGGVPVDVDVTFGLTEWSVSEQAQYAQYLGSVPEDNVVVEDMRHIDEEQSYGLGRIKNVPFKGGWSDAEDGSFHVRQLGFTTIEETTYGIAIAARNEDGDSEQCQKALDKLAKYLKDMGVKA